MNINVLRHSLFGIAEIKRLILFFVKILTSYNVCKKQAYLQSNKTTGKIKTTE